MDYQHFPAWFYHADQPPALVDDEEGFNALGDGWFPSPLLEWPAVPEAPEPADLKAAWAEIAGVLGMEVDRRWKLDRLKTEVKEHAAVIAELHKGG